MLLKLRFEDFNQFPCSASALFISTGSVKFIALKILSKMFSVPERVVFFGFRRNKGNKCQVLFGCLHKLMPGSYDKDGREFLSPVLTDRPNASQLRSTLLMLACLLPHTSKRGV